jgi:hypothetical protein
MRSVSDDHRQARVDVVRAERVIAERAAEFTPVRPPSSADVKAARKASGEFQAADVAAILAEGKP